MRACRSRVIKRHSGDKESPTSRREFQHPKDTRGKRHRRGEGSTCCARLFASRPSPLSRRLELDSTNPPSSTTRPSLQGKRITSQYFHHGSNRPLAHPRAICAPHTPPNTQPQALSRRCLHLDLPVPQSGPGQRRQRAPQLARRGLLPTDMQTAILWY